jgi:hypothetical protein
LLLKRGTFLLEMLQYCPCRSHSHVVFVKGSSEKVFSA